MRLPHFQLFAPSSVQDACSLLDEYGSEALLLAGGTDLLVKMKQRKIVPTYIINLKNISGLDQISYDEHDGLRIGPLATIQSIKNSIVVKRHCKILAQAAGVESSVQIRNLATIGGNIANASPAADAPLALVSLRASIVIASSTGEREIPIEDLFTGPGKTSLQPGEIIREIHVPALPPRSGGAYLKHAIRRTDIAIVSTAVVVSLANDLCADIRIALGSVAPTAFRAKGAEGLLKGKKITAALAEQAAYAAIDESRPIGDIRSHAEHRQDIILMLTNRAVMEAVRDARLGGI
jgi:CO/xanthine dehydrogenase FAD-binding subunit